MQSGGIVFLDRSVGRDLLHRWLSFRTAPQNCTGALDPNSRYRGSEWLYRYRTLGNVSQYRFLPAASRTVAEIY
jgi:hypothetical protein